MLGQLQRGLGSGARAALEGGPGAAEAVLACIAEDPRWDQLDERSDYLARLVLALGIDIATVDGLLQTYGARTPEDERERVPLVLEVVGRLSRLGNGDAAAVLLREAAEGRYQDDAAGYLADEVPFCPSSAPQSDLDLSSWTTEELLAGGSAPPWPALRELRTRDSPDDVAAMLRVTADGSGPMCPTAISALAYQGRAELLPMLLTLSADTKPSRVRTAMHRAFSLLPFAVTRATAIEWASSGSSERRRAATLAFAEHASAADVPIVRELFASQLDRGTRAHQYMLCDLAEALGRCPESGPFPELRQAYRGMVYSFGRFYVVEAMAATEPDFPHDLAIECLWDCNEQIREVAALHASFDDPVAARRLAELAHDSYEDADVRRAASSRF